MRSDLKRNFITFFKTVTVCSVCFFILSFSLFVPKSTTKASETVSGIPFESVSNNIFNILIELSEQPFVFTLKLNCKTKSCSVTCIPTATAKSGYEKFVLNSSADSVKRLTGFISDRQILLSNEDIISVINYCGGITAAAPYGIPSSAGSGEYISTTEKIHMYGHTVIQLLSADTHPNTERLAYYAEVFAIVCKAFLSDFSEEKYFILANSKQTNISYSDFYDNASRIENCFEAINYSAPDGVWINDSYYLQ